MGACQEINKPVVDETALPCEELISANCVVATESRALLKIGIGDTLTTMIMKISNAIQLVSNKFNNTINLTTLPTYANDAAALAGGLPTGKAYMKPTGELMIKL